MLMYFYTYFIVILFACSVYIYIVKYKHFLLMLLSLEFVVLSLYLLMLMYFTQVLYNNFVCMFFLCMSVSESVLGLSLLVLLIRTHGVDMVLMFDNLW